MTLVADLIRYSQLDDQDHAFAKYNEDRTVWLARCGHIAPGDQVFHADGQTPTCLGCLGPWLKAIIEQGEAVADRVESRHGAILGVGSNDASG